MMFAKVNDSEIVNINQVVFMEKIEEGAVLHMTDGSAHNVLKDNVENVEKLMKFSNKATERVAFGNF